ncbi:unnamed protein product [Eretmochelys imbricata]
MAGTILPTPAGTDLGWSIEEARWHHGRDWPLTSSGVGLENRPPQPFPPPAARSTVHQPLPPGAERPLREELIRRLATTTGLCHDVKTHGGVLGQPGYPLPAPLGRVHCNKDLRDKAAAPLLAGPADPGGAGPARPGTDSAAGPTCPPSPPTTPAPSPSSWPPHHSDGASKSMVASTENKPLAGSVFYVRDGAVLSRLDPYVSITSRDVRAFTPQELQGYARKDALTYWQFEGHPKAWGHGLRDSSLASSPAPPALPAYPCWPLLFHTGGALSLAQESYGPPHHTPSGQGPPNPGPPPSAPPMTGPQILAVPLMYRTESQGYGSSKPGPV